jgi:hypothetical protein
LFFFGASNPTIKNGGMLMESKIEIDELIPGKYKPQTLFFTANTSIFKIKAAMRDHQLQFPLIVKPDIGMHGKAVIKVHNDLELNNAINQFTVDYIIQPFIPYPKELGIFYVRYPDEQEGFITGIVEKQFVTVKGDGFQTIGQLLMHDPRYVLQLPALRKTLGETLHEILERDKERVLVPYGNHARGALFMDSSHLINLKLVRLMDKVCRSINGFHFGRLDIRFKSLEDLQDDRNWCIIELNGAGSEPTHIYDPKHSIFFAWREIIRHWRMLCRVSMQNRRKGFAYLSFKEGIMMFIENNRYVNRLNDIQFEHIGIDKDVPSDLVHADLRIVK